MLDEVQKIDLNLSDLTINEASAPAKVNIDLTEKDPSASNNDEAPIPQYKDFDENDILSSTMTFEELGLRKEIVSALYNLGFTRPSKIQAKAIPDLLKNPDRDLVAQGQTGTGKTAAFATVMISNVNKENRAPQVICVAPSRELALQTHDVINQLNINTHFTTRALVPPKEEPRVPGGPPPSSAKKYKPVSEQIVVGTPGFIFEHIKKRLLKVECIKLLVLDEADALLVGDIGTHTSHILKSIKADKKDLQIALFSATFPRVVDSFIESLRNPIKILLEKEEVSLTNINHFFFDCSGEEKDVGKSKLETVATLYDVLGPSQSIVFCAKRDSADILSNKLKTMGYGVGILHGKVDTAERDATMKAFRLGDVKVLITTDMLARGIDVANITLVINYELPAHYDNYNRIINPVNLETYTHRVGRTGRFARRGVSVILIDSADVYEQVQFIERKTDIKINALSNDDWEPTEKTLQAAMK